ncbi:MAG: prepilin-type N-terminal cleavage/methylation domain-containing protein [Candidatus Saccharimonadales bacterium]
MKKQTSTGFTIVELLIVIVVIGILAAITIVAYNGVQGRARDTQRIADLKGIAKALEVYKINNGAYPTPVSTPNASSWEVSTNGSNVATNFLSALVSTNGVSKVPVDPTNTGVTLNPSFNSATYEYFYYVYAAGTSGCDPARGAFYILGATRMDSVPAGQNSAASPGFSCPSRDWAVNGAWVTGGFTN